MTDSPPPHNRPFSLSHIPVTLFTIIMGVGGLGLAWRQASAAFDLTAAIGELILALAVTAAVGITLAYGLKAVFHWPQVRRDIADPATSNYLSAVTIGLLVLVKAVMPYAPAVAEAMWGVAATLQFLLTLWQVNLWITRNYEITTSNPSWFLPAGGSLLVADSGVGLGYVEVSWCLFAFGLVLWIVLFAIVMNRIIFHDQIPAKAVPTLFIMIAPPALGFLSYQTLMGGKIDAFARILFYSALMTTALVFSLARRFSRLPFTLSWWAYTFPLDAICVATLRYAQATGAPALENIAVILLGATTVIVVGVAGRTVKALIDGDWLRPEFK